MSAVRQQINLYQPAARAERVSFSSATAGKLIGSVTVCLLAMWGYGLWQVHRLQASVSSLQQQQQHQQETMTALGAARTLGVGPEEIEARVKELTADLAVHSSALEMLRSGSVGQTAGFSKRLIALARHSVSGLWIDHLSLSGMNGSMSLGGAALNPELVPNYLHDLGKEPALTGIRFDQLLIEQPRAAKSFKFHAESNSALIAATREPAS